MTNSQVLELDLSAVQFEEVSDENASIIQGGTGDGHEGGGNGNGNGNGNGLPDELSVALGFLNDFFVNLGMAESFDDVIDAAELYVELLDEAF